MVAHGWMVFAVCRDPRASKVCRHFFPVALRGRETSARLLCRLVVDALKPVFLVCKSSPLRGSDGESACHGHGRQLVDVRAGPEGRSTDPTRALVGCLLDVFCLVSGACMFYVAPL